MYYSNVTKMFRTIFLCMFAVLYANADITITTPNGVLQGRVEYSQQGNSFYAFQQIPYGTPPVGNLRFKEPQPAGRWEGIYDATEDNKICFQQTSTASSAENEDCLYVNVYIPVYPPPTETLPVMVWFYGGGFVTGAGDFYAVGPHYWMEQEVIIVTVSYRVGAFGFLTTGDTVIPGNYGLKDQLLALKWVQENIQSFGGDPNKVTIFGQSAGAASVTYQLMTEKSAGLFRAAIAISGSTLCPWGYQRHYKEVAYTLASIIDPNFNANSSSEELLQFLQNVPASDIKSASIKFPQSWYDTQIIDGFLFTPVIEPEHENAFITERMYAALEDGKMQKVPLIIGTTSEEMVWDALDPESFYWSAYNLDTNLDSLVNDNMEVTDKSQKQVVGEAIRKIYTDGLFQDKIGNAVEFYSDTSFGRPIIQHAKLQSQYSDVYFYQFSYYGTLPGTRPYIDGAYKVAHGDDINYFWAYSNNSNLHTYPPGDILTSQRYRILFSNFAKSLNPVSDHVDILGVSSWPTVKPDNFQYLDINETLTIKTDLKKRTHDGWVDVYNTYRTKPYDTF